MNITGNRLLGCVSLFSFTLTYHVRYNSYMISAKLAYLTHY